MPEVTEEMLDKICTEMDTKYCESCRQGIAFALNQTPAKAPGNNDKINGGFELFGSLFIVFSIIQVWMDKSVAGVSLYHVGFFTLWGYWNLYYYRAIQQRFSFLASIAVTAANTIWLALLIYYKYS